MAEPSATPIVDRVLEEAGIRPFSIVGGARLSNLLHKAIELDRARREPDSPGESETLYLKDGDWAFDIDDDSCSEEAWWVELQLFDPEDESDQVRTVIAELSLSDVELEGLITAATDILNEGRARFS